MPRPIAIVQLGNVKTPDQDTLVAAGYSVVRVHDMDGIKLSDKTLRDEFAMAALQGMYASKACNTDGDVGGYAEAAFSIADAMLEERNKEEKLKEAA